MFSFVILVDDNNMRQKNDCLIIYFYFTDIQVNIFGVIPSSKINSVPSVN